MDYIIFGLGVGATLTLVGWAFREWGSALRDRSSSGEEAILSGHELVDRMAWQRFCRSCGAVLAIFGLLVLLATIIATALMLSNTTGATIVLATLAGCVVATLVWLGLFLHRFGARGILRPKSTKHAPARMVSREGTGDISGDTEAAVPLVGPPVPGEGDSIAAGHVQRPGVMVPQDVEVSADTEPFNDDDGRVKIEDGAAEPVENIPTGERSGVEGESDDDAPPITGPVIANDDDAGDDEPTQVGDVGDTPEPATGKRRIVMVPAKGEVGSSQSPRNSSESDNAASPDATLTDGGTDDSDGELRPPSGASSGADPGSDDERPPEVEASPSSGRADAVRKLRQRRIKRLTPDSSAPE